MTDAECRFDWAESCCHPDVARGERVVLVIYLCRLCVRVHWCLPWAEADGTAANVEKAKNAGREALRAAETGIVHDLTIIATWNTVFAIGAEGAEAAGLEPARRIAGRRSKPLR